MASRISKLAGDYAGDLILPLSTLTTGGSKLLATFQLIGGVLVTKVLGPLGAVAGIVYGITSATLGWARAVDIVGQAMDRAAAKNAMVKQLAEITKSVATAKAKLTDLLSFAQNAPFSLTNIIEGGKALAQVSAGALLTKKNLALVGDSAAATGQQFGKTANAVADLYDDLKNGRPVEESAKAMKDMGVFSQDTVDKLVNLQRSGANLGITFDVATEAMKKNAGAMKEVVQTIEDLQEKQNQVKAGILTPAGQIFTDSTKKGIEAQTALLEKLAPVLTIVFRVVARVSDALGFFQRNIVSLIAIIPGLGKVLGLAITGFTVLAAATASVSILKFLNQIELGVRSLRAYTREAGGAVAAARAFQAANDGRMSTGWSQLVGISAQGRYGQEGGLIGPRMAPAMAARQAVGGASNIAMGAVSKVAAGSLNLVRSAVSYLGEGLLSLVATPLAATLTGFAAVAVVAGLAYDKFQAATAAVDEMDEALNKNAESFNKQIAGIRNAGDAAVVYQNALNGAKDAQEALAKVKAERSGNGWEGAFGAMDWLGQQDSKEQAATSAVVQNQAYAKLAQQQGRSIKMAVSPELQGQEQAAYLGIQQGAMANDLALSTPEQKQKILMDRMNDARDELMAKQKTQAELDALSVTPDSPDRKAAIQDALDNSGSEEMQIQGKINKTDPKDARAIQVLQEQLQNSQAIHGDYAQKANAALSGDTSLKLRNQQSDSERGILDDKMHGVMLDKEAMSIAENYFGLLKDKEDLIKNNLDLTDKEKAIQIDSLRLTQMQVAQEIYRNKVAQAAQGLRARADAAGMSGNSKESISLNTAADKLEDDLKEKQRVQNYYDQNKNQLGQNDTLAQVNAEKSAGIDRLLDVRQRAMSKIQNIPMPNVGSGGQGKPWTPDLAHILSPEELATLPKSANPDGAGGGNGLFSQSIKTALPGFADGGLDDVNLPKSMLGEDALNPGAGGASPFPKDFTGVMASDPLLKVNSDQLTELKNISALISKSGGNVH